MSLPHMAWDHRLFLYCFCYFFVYIPVHVSNSMQETKKKRKKIPLTRGEVEIRQRMTVEELAQAMGKDIGESLPWETATSLIALPPVGKAKMSSVALGSGCRSIPWEGKSYPSQRKCWETQCRLKRKEAGPSKYQGRHLNVKKPGLSALSSRKASDSCAGCSLWLWFPGANLFQKEKHCTLVCQSWTPLWVKNSWLKSFSPKSRLGIGILASGAICVSLEQSFD